MSYLITGATGLVGKEIVKLCRKKGIAINYLTTKKSKIVSEKNYQGFYWNPATGEIDKACFEGVTTIINLAGASISKKWTKSYKKQILSSRVDAVKTLFNALKDGGYEEIVSLVSASAIGIYPSSFEKYYNENEQGVAGSFLGEVVRQWEAEVDEFNALNISIAKIRIGLVLGLEGGALPQMAKPIKMLLGAAFGSGEQWQSWVCLNDLARVFMFAAKNKLTGVFNAVAPNPITQNKLIKEIAKTLEKPLLLPNIPEFLVKMALGEMAYLILESQRVSCKKIEEEGFVFYYPNISSTLSSILYREGESYKSKYKKILKEQGS